MLKIKDSLLRKIIKDKHLTNKEMAFLFFVLQRSDETGLVKGLYYKDVSETIDCSVAQYYNIIKRLCKMRYIKKSKDKFYKSDMDIYIYDNDFTGDNGYKNYVDINIALFQEERFINSRAGAKRLSLYLLFRIKKQSHKEKDRNKLPYRNYSKIAKYLGITDRMLLLYFKELEDLKIISIGDNINIKNKKMNVITVNVASLETPKIIVTEKGKTNEVNTYPSYMHDLHFVRTACRHDKIDFDCLNLNNATILLRQYKNISNEKGKNIYNIFMSAIRNLEENILDSKLIHYIMKSLVNKDYTNDIVIFN